MSNQNQTANSGNQSISQPTSTSTSEKSRRADYGNNTMSRIAKRRLEHSLYEARSELGYIARDFATVAPNLLAYVDRVIDRSIGHEQNSSGQIVRQDNYTEPKNIDHLRRVVRDELPDIRQRLKKTVDTLDHIHNVIFKHMEGQLETIDEEV